MKRLFLNGHIFTSNSEMLYADSILVEDGRITWIGDSAAADAKAQGRAAAETSVAAEADETIDLGGRTVIPGIIDAHMHPMMLAEYSKQIACLPPSVNSIEDLVNEIAKASELIDARRCAGEKTDAAETDAEPQNEWIRGWGFDEGKYAEKRMPNRYDLDRGCADKPVFLVRSCEHIRCANSKALEIAGITKDTPDPVGGKIDRDENGEPTGILRESARDLVIPFMPKDTEEQLVNALVDLGKLLTYQGITAVGDMGNLHPGGNYDFFTKAKEKGFRQRATLYYMWDYFWDDPDFDITREMMDPERDIRIAGLKLIGDGSISGRTAWLSEPYLGSDEYGFPVYTDEMMEKAIAFAKRTGCQISVHAMGGQAIDRVVDRMYEENDWTDGKSPYLRVEHLTEPSKSAIAKAAEKGFAFATQPIFEFCEIETYKANMDEERLKQLYPVRTMLDGGVSLCISTDAPATSWATPSDPFVNIKAAVTRRAYDGTDIGQDERLDVETAIILYTKKAAEICGFAGAGQLASGYSADFVVLSDDIFSVDPERIDSICASQTWIKGERVY